MVGLLRLRPAKQQKLGWENSYIHNRLFRNEKQTHQLPYLTSIESAIPSPLLSAESLHISPQFETQELTLTSKTTL